MNIKVNEGLAGKKMRMKYTKKKGDKMKPYLLWPSRGLS